MPERATPRLSVIVPCYNVEPYLAQTLVSLARSRHGDIEFILVDDASTDGTPAILAERADFLGRVTVLDQPRHVGVSAARNAGLDVANGTYIAFLDGDDWVEPGYYPRLLAAIERLGCEMLRTDHVKVKGRRRTVHRIAHGPRGVVTVPRDAILPVDRLSSIDFPNAWAGINHRRLADSGALRFAEHLRTAEDRLWIWRMHLQARSFAVLGMLGLFYRRGVPTSLSAIGDDRQLDFISAYSDIFAELDRDREGARYRPKAIRSFCVMINHHLLQQQRLTSALQSQLVGRSRTLLARLPAAEVGTVRSGLDEERRDRLRTVLPG